MDDRPPVRKQRRTTISAEQDDLLRAECKRRGKSEKAVFDEIIDAGFEAYFSRRRKHAEEAAPPVAAREDAATAALTATLWSGYTMFDFLRWLMKSMGLDVDDPAYPVCGMSRYMCTHSVGEQTRVWRDAGRHLQEGRDFNAALRLACAAQGVDFDEFAGLTRSNHPGG